jgi:hypothetical protein
MRVLGLFFALLFFPLAKAMSYELMLIQSVSTSRKSFVTRSGKRQGIQENLTATFVADNVSYIARARTVTSHYTQWELVNPEATVPFQPGTLATYHPAEEYIWTLNPEKARLQYIRDLRAETKRSWIIKGAATRGLSESVSNVAIQNPNRGGIALDAIFEKLFDPNFAWDVGLRYENEIVNLEFGTLIAQRVMLIGHFLYYFDPIPDFYKGRVFLGAGIGFGRTSTNVQGIIQSGSAQLLPSAKLGLSLPFNDLWDFIVEGAFESIRSVETLEDRSRQSTNQTNGRLGIGLRKFF